MEFRLEPALERRDPGSVITAIALDDDGGRIYVGTSDGAFEEWNRHSGGGRAVLGARRHVGASRKPVAAISYVGAARKVAVLIDGNVSLLDEETLDAVPMPAGEGWRSVGGGGGGGGSGSREAAPPLPLLIPSPSSGGLTAIAAAPPPCSSAGAAAASDDAAFSASCLAVAGRARGRLLGGLGGGGGGGTSRAAVFFVVPAGRGERGVGTLSPKSSSSSSSPSPPPAVCVHSVEWSEPLAVTTVAWAGSGALVLGSALRYSLWRLQPPLSAAAAASAAAASGGGAPSSPRSAVVPLLELSADAPAATPVALPLPSLAVSPPPQKRKDRVGGSSKEEEEEEEGRATAAELAVEAATAGTAAIPSAVLLLVERAGVAVGADGMPARGRPGAATFAEAPTALATVAGGLAVAAACPAGVLVHDAVTGAAAGGEGGLLRWPDGAAPARGQKLLAASPAHSSSSASNSSSYALVCGMRRAWALVPVSARERAVAALGARRFGEAAAAALASLAAAGRGGGGGGEDDDEEGIGGLEAEPSFGWEEDVAAEAGLALLFRALLSSPPPPAATAAPGAAGAAEAEGGEGAEKAMLRLAGEALAASSLHPAELFPLLPGEGAPWAGEAARAAAASAERRRERLMAKRGAEGAALVAATTALSPLAPGRQNAAATAAASRAMLALRRRGMRKKTTEAAEGSSSSSSLREGVDTVAAVLAARAAGEEAGEEKEEGGGSEPSSSSSSALSSLSSLLRSPSFDGRMSVVAPALEAAGEHSLLAAALAAGGGEGGGAGEALRVWREVAEGKRRERRGRSKEKSGSRGAASSAAAEAAADLLSDPRRASVALVAENVPWLLSVTEEAKGSPLPSAAAAAAAAAAAPAAAAAAAAAPAAAAAAAPSSLFSSPVSPSEVLGEWPLPPAARALLSRTRRRGTTRREGTGGGGGGAGGGGRDADADSDDSFSTEQALQLLPADEAPEARAAFLVHLVFGDGEKDDAEEAAAKAATELALLLVSVAASALPPSTPSGESPAPDWKRAEAARAAWIEHYSASSSAGGGRGGLLALRARRALRALLLPPPTTTTSGGGGGDGSLHPPPSLDLAAVSSALSATDLWEERALAELAGGRAEAAARLLLLVCRDPEAAVEVAVRGRGGALSSCSSLLLTPDALLSMLLSPGEGRGPLLEDAVALLDCVTGMATAAVAAANPGSEEEKGKNSGGGGGAKTAPPLSPPPPPQPLLLLPPLDASSILSAMGDATPLGDVSALLRRLLRARVRGRRAATFAKALARAEALAAAAEKGQLATRRAAVVDGARSCAVCGARIGLKVFAVVPPPPGKGGKGEGAVCCMRCVREKENEN